MTSGLGKKPQWDVCFFQRQNLSSCGVKPRKRRVLADGGERPKIPNQLRDEPLIRVCPPDDPGVVHQHCSSPGKQPCTSTEDPEPVETIRDWLANGGNAGCVATADRPLIILDVDDNLLAELADDYLPETFTVSTGSPDGEHRYFRCSGWTRNVVIPDDLGNLQADNWHGVIPPSRHESGGRYTVAVDAEIATVAEADLEEFLRAAGWTPDDADSDRQHRGGEEGGAGGSGGAAAASAPGVGGIVNRYPIPGEYPSRDSDSTSLKKWVESNGLDSKLEQSSSSDWSGDEWVVAKCLAEGGFAEDIILDFLTDELPSSAKWHRYDDRPERQAQYRVRTVRKAIRAACDDDYVDFSDTAYKPSGDTDDGERRKTESGDGAPDTKEVTTMSSNDDVNYTDKEEALVQEPSGDGDRFQKVVRVIRTEDGEEVEYLALKKGRVEEMTTMDGETALVQNVTESKSLGSPDYIDDLIDGLEELKEKLNGQKATADD